MMRVRDRERNRRLRAWYARHILILTERGADDDREGVSSGRIDGPHDGSYVPMTDLSILCLHNSTTSWESQQRGGIVEDVMGDRKVGGRLLWWVARVCELTGGPGG